MTNRENLKRLNEVAELRSKKLDEIREFLSISPEADARDVLVIMKWWRQTAANEPSVSPELKTKAERLSREFHGISDASGEIIDRLEALGRLARR